VARTAALGQDDDPVSTRQETSLVERKSAPEPEPLLELVVEIVTVHRIEQCLAP
jgi:hypothetical protein